MVSINLGVCCTKMNTVFALHNTPQLRKRHICGQGKKKKKKKKKKEGIYEFHGLEFLDFISLCFLVQYGENTKESPDTLTTHQADITSIPQRCYPSQTRTDRQGTEAMVSSTFGPLGSLSLTFRISLLRTLQICWMSAALWETASRELPESWSSSLTLGEVMISTPGWQTTRRTYFSPKKLLDTN